MGDSNIITLDEGWNKQIKVVALDPLEVDQSQSLLSYKLPIQLTGYWRALDHTGHAGRRLQDEDQTILQPGICQSLHVRLH